MSKRNQKRFDEYFAKVVLEYCFPERYHDLEVKDKPDLQGKGVGVEVTNCTPSDVREGFVRCRRVRAAGKSATNRDLERIKQLRAVQITERGIVWNQGCYSDDLDKSPLRTFLNAVENKLEKLNSATAGYAEREHYDLFVNSALDVADGTGVLETLSHLLSRIAQWNLQERKFEFVYLMTINQSLVVFDMCQGYSYIKHLYNRIELLAQRARAMIKGATNE